MFKPKANPIDFIIDIPAAAKRLKQLDKDNNEVSLALSAITMFIGAEKDPSAPAEHSVLLPDGGTYDDLLTNCLCRLENEIESLEDEDTPLMLEELDAIDA